MKWRGGCSAFEGEEEEDGRGVMERCQSSRARSEDQSRVFFLPLQKVQTTWYSPINWSAGMGVVAIFWGLGFVLVSGLAWLGGW